MKLIKDNVVNEELFNALRAVDPDIVKNMIHNMITMNVEEEDERVDANEINDWIRNNCNGLVYYADVGVTHFGTHLAYRFEQEEDMVAFKLRWA